VSARALVIPADGNAHRATFVALDAECQRHAPRHAVAGHHDRGTVGDRLLVGSGHRLHADHAAAGVLNWRADRGLFLQPGARFHCVTGQHLVEIGAGTDQTVVGIGGQLRPRHLEAQATADDTQSLVVQPAGALTDVDAEFDERSGPTRSEPIAADLLARERGLFKEQDVEAGGGHPVRRATAAGSGTDNDDVGIGG
jgi:hypothetical protein